MDLLRKIGTITFVIGLMGPCWLNELRANKQGGVILMVKKLASYIAVAATIVGSALPALASDCEAGDVLAFPFKVVGSSVSTVVGAPLGATKGGVEGGIKATKYVADKMGDKESPVKTTVAAVIAGPFGVVGGATVGTFKGMIHGAKIGYKEPFSMESFQLKDE